MSNSTQEITTTIDSMSLRSPKGTHCLNLMRYHGVYIGNTYYHQPSSIVT